MKSDDKKRARINAMRYVLHALPYTGKDAARIGAAPTSSMSAANTISTPAGTADQTPVVVVQPPPA
jgi:hypothetical protein